MPALMSRSVSLLGATLALAVLVAPASAADTPFTARFSETVRGDISAVGNTLMTCSSAATNCTAAQNRTASGSALNNNSYTMGRVDVDGDASTFDSSSATVALPAGSTVEWAGLYWAADTTAGALGTAAPTPSSRGTVRFKVGADAYQTISASASDVIGSTTQPNRYRAFRDVTSLLPATGSGTYTVANVQAGTGADRFAGWALFIAYREPSQALRRLNVYDGLGTVDSSHTFTTTIAPFHTPVAGPVTTRSGLLTFEGDAGLATETARFNGQVLTDALNPASNPMNSTIGSGGALLTAKSPNYANQLGVDLDTFTNAGALGNDQTSASLAFSSTNEYFMPAAFFLVSDEGAPISSGAPEADGLARDGDTLTADPGSWNGTGPLTYEYQWQRCDASGANCTDIVGATQSTYVPGSGDIGSTIRVIVTASNDAGESAPATSGPTAVVLPAAPSNATPPSIGGTAAQGQTLTADPGTWTGAGPVTHDYQWQRCDADGNNCVDIPGATGPTYTPGADDAGHTVRVVVTATNSGGSTTTATPPTAIVPAVSDPGSGGGSGGQTDPGNGGGNGNGGQSDPGNGGGQNGGGQTDPAIQVLGTTVGDPLSEASCQQLVGGAKYRRVKLAASARCACAPTRPGRP
jgi:hypothetical protein